MMSFQSWLFALLTLSLTTATLAKDVMDLIPSDAYGYVVVQRMIETEQALQALAERTRIPLPDLKQLVGATEDWVDGIDEMGSVAVVLVPTPDGPSVVLYVPVDDYGAFLRHLSVKDSEQTVCEATLMGKSVVVARRANYAAITWPANRALLAATTEREAAPSSWGMLEERHDVAAAVSPAGVKMLCDLGRKGLAAVKATISAEFGEESPVLSGIEVYEHLLRAIQSEVTSLRLGLEFDSDGSLRVHEMVNVAPSGKFLPLLSGLRLNNSDLLRGLPNVPFVLACGGEIPAGAAESMLEFSGEMMKSMQQLYGLSPEQVDELIKMSLAQMPDIEGMAFLVGVGTGDSPLYNEMLATIRVRDASAYMAAYRTYWDKFLKLSDATNSPLFKGLKLEDITLGGKEAFKMTMSTDAFKEFAPPAGNLDLLMEKLYGPNGLTIYFAAADDRTILLGYTDKRLLEQAIGSIGSETDHLSRAANVGQTAKLLPSGGMVTGYWDGRGSVQFANRAIRVISGNAPALPEFPSAPPVGWTMTVENGVLHFQSIAPTEFLDSVGTYVDSLSKLYGKGDVAVN